MLESECALDDVRDFVRLGMNVPRRRGARRERVNLNIDLFSFLAGQSLGNQLLGADLALSFRLAGKRGRPACQDRKQSPEECSSECHDVTLSIAIVLAFRPIVNGRASDSMQKERKSSRFRAEPIWR
jgi:hypothetical protein